MFGELNNAEIKSILSNNIIGRIGCFDGHQSYIFPISYAYHDNSIYCHSREGHKMNIMRKNKSVCFQVDEVSNMANWRSVMGWGVFEEITHPEKRREAIRFLAERVLPVMSSETTHIFPHWPFPPTDLNEIKGLIFKITLEQCTGRFERYDKFDIES